MTTVIVNHGQTRMLELVTEELMDALRSKNKAGILHALEAFVHMVQKEDEEADNDTD